MHYSQTVIEDATITTKKARIAVVDDDPRIRKLLEDELTDLNYQSTCFDNAFDLLENLADCAPALVLLDLLMPQMDGIECLRRLRRVGYRGVVIIFSALSDNERRQEAELEGANEYILKPDLFEFLEQVLTRHLQG